MLKSSITRDQAYALLTRYNREPFHIQHAETVSKVMGEFAKEYDPENVDFWRTVGMLLSIFNLSYIPTEITEKR